MLEGVELETEGAATKDCANPRNRQQSGVGGVHRMCKGREVTEKRAEKYNVRAHTETGKFEFNAFVDREPKPL